MIGLIFWEDVRCAQRGPEKDARDPLELRFPFRPLQSLRQCIDR